MVRWHGLELHHLSHSNRSAIVWHWCDDHRCLLDDWLGPGQIRSVWFWNPCTSKCTIYWWKVWGKETLVEFKVYTKIKYKSYRQNTEDQSHNSTDKDVPPVMAIVYDARKRAGKRPDHQQCVQHWHQHFAAQRRNPSMNVPL